MAAAVTEYGKTEDGVLDYLFNWTAWLAGDTISTYVLEVPAGITLDADSDDGSIVTAWLSGGLEGNNYRIKNKIVTNGGRTESRSITIRIIDG